MITDQFSVPPPGCYLTMEPVVGGCATVLLALILSKTSALMAADAVVLGLPIWKVAVGVHLTCWILQFIGHGVFEGMQFPDSG